MAIDPQALLHFPVPEIRQELTRRDAAFYALSTGLAQDPTDPRQLDFVDGHRRLKALPSLVLVLAHPGFWLARPETGVDAGQVVHGEQSMEIFRPVPVEGAVANRTRIAGLVDRGVGRGALLYIENEVLDLASGEKIALTRSTAVLRGDGGFGGPSGPVEPPAPDPVGAPDVAVDLPTRPEQALYYRLNGDHNPIHADPVVAVQAGFPRPILHGLCTFGVVCHALVRALADYDPDRLRSMRLRFSAPVFPGETIRTEIWRDGGFRARVVERDSVVVTNGRAAFGPAPATSAAPPATGQTG